jgi:hypothetical protein
VRWLGNTINVDIDALADDEFGPVQSGRLTLRGPLSVLRLEDSDQETRFPFYSDAIYPRKRSARMFSDLVHQPLQRGPFRGPTNFRTYMFAGSKDDPDWTPGESDVFYMPLRIMDEFVDGLKEEYPVLTGLLLKPTGKETGEYQRIGCYKLLISGTESVSKY